MKNSLRYFFNWQFLLFIIFFISSGAFKSWAITPAKMKNTKLIKIAFVGDSLTEGHGLESESSFPAQIEKILLQKKYLVKSINGGVSGATASAGFEAAKWLIKQKPDVLVVALGANDGLRGLPLTQTKKYLAQIIELGMKEGSKILLLGIKLPLNYEKKYREELEKLYLELAQKYQVAFQPFFLDKVAGIKKLNNADGIHPNSKGQYQIALNILPDLISIIDPLITPVKNIPAQNIPVKKKK